MKVEFLDKSYNIEIWKGERLGPYIACDTETTIVPFTETPDLVTFQAFDGSRLFYIRRADVRAFLDLHKNANIIWHNAPFDIDVICKALDDKNYFDHWVQLSTVWDTAILYRLLGLATNGFVPHKYSLALVTKELLDEELPKIDNIRTGFNQYVNTEIENIDRDFLIYGAKDVIATFFIYTQLIGKVQATGSSTYLSHKIQLAGAIALNRVYKNGIGFDLERADQILTKLNKKMALQQDILRMYGWSRGFKGAKSAYEKIVKDHLGLNLPVTEDGSISSKAEDLEQYRNHQFVDAYLSFIELEKQASFLKPIVETHK